MPSTLEAGVILLVLIAPGFLLQRGYQRGRTYPLPSLNLYATLQALVLSGVILLVSAPVGGFSVARWVDNDTLTTDHRWAAWTYFIVLLALPYPIGLLAGRVAETIAAPKEHIPAVIRGSWGGQRLLAVRRRFQGSPMHETIKWFGFLGAPTAWTRHGPESEGSTSRSSLSWT
jgi:uncharacterized protein DUF6338